MGLKLCVLPLVLLSGLHSMSVEITTSLQNYHSVMTYYDTMSSYDTIDLDYRVTMSEYDNIMTKA